MRRHRPRALLPCPRGSDGASLTRLTFVNKDNSEVDILVETADTPEERSVGLMHRESLPEDQGMLFIFEQEGQHSFYMRNTLIPLSIAFIEGEGAIVEIEDMEPLTDDLHSGPEPYLYAIEVNQGWFARQRHRRRLRSPHRPYSADRSAAGDTDALTAI